MLPLRSRPIVLLTLSLSPHPQVAFRKNLKQEEVYDLRKEESVAVNIEKQERNYQQVLAELKSKNALHKNILLRTLFRTYKSNNSLRPRNSSYSIYNQSIISRSNVSLALPILLCPDLTFSRNCYSA